MKKGKTVMTMILCSLLPLGMAFGMSSMKPATAESDTVDFYDHLALSEATVMPSGGVSYEDVKILSGEYTYTFTTEELTGHTGHNLIIALDVKAKSRAAKADITALLTKDVQSTFYLSTQWTRLYLPLTEAGLSGLKISTDEDLYIGAASFTDYGTEDLTGKYDRMGQWLLEDFTEVKLTSADLVSANASKDLKICGNYLYAIGSGKLTIVDISDVSSPVVKSTLSGVGESARQLGITEDGKYVIVTSRESGAFIVNVEDPANPYIATMYNSIEFANGMDIVGDIAMIGNRQYGVEIVDISNPESPRHIATVDVGGEAQSSTYYDGVIYSGLWGAQALTITDVSDFYHSAIKSTLSLPGKADGVTVYKTSEGKTLCFISICQRADKSVSEGGTAPQWNNWAFGQGNGFVIVDATDMENPEIVSVTRLDGRYYYQNNDYWDVSVAEHNGHLYAYTVNTRMGVYVFDCTDVTAPERVMKITAEELSGESLGEQSRYVMFPYDEANAPQDSIGAVGIKDGTMFFAGTDNGIMKYAATDLFFDEYKLTSTAELDTTGEDDYYAFDGTGLEGFKQFRTEGQIYTALSYEDHIFVAAGREGIIVLSEDLTRLNTIPTRSTRGIVFDIKIQDGKLYAAMGEDGLVTYEIDGTDLNFVRTYVNGTVRDFSLSKTGKFAAVVYKASTGAIVNLETGETLISQGVGSQMYSRNTAVVGGRYLGLLGSSTRQYWYDCGADESATTKPTKVSQTKVVNTMYTTVIDYQGKAMTINSSNELVTFLPNSGVTDTSVTPPTEKFKKLLYENIGRQVVYKDTMIVSNPISRHMTFFDFSTPTNPIADTHYETVGNPNIATITDEMVLVPLGYQGLIKFDYSNVDFEPEGHVNHCICGGNLTENAAKSAHTCLTTNPVWQPLNNSDFSTKMKSEGVSAPAYFYLEEDITIGSQISFVANQNVTLCLNGKTVKYTGTARDFLMNADGIKFTICDCQGSGCITKTQVCTSGSGLIQLSKGVLNIYGGDLKDGKAKTYGGAIATSAGTELNMYGGSITNAVSQESYGGSIRVYSTFNMYGGLISGGSSVDGGGNIYVGSSGTFNMYGGTITGGTTTVKTADKNSGGGNIYINSGKFYMYGGTVSEGTALKDGGKGAYGGNILIGAVTVEISGGEILNGNAATNGSNINAFSSNAKVSFTGGTVKSSNTTKDGYLFYVNGGSDGKETNVTFKGDVHFVDATGSSTKNGVRLAHQYQNSFVQGGIYDCNVIAERGDVEISGGYFAKKVVLGTTYPDQTTLSITGGHYASTLPEANIADGFLKLPEQKTLYGTTFTSYVGKGYVLTLLSRTEDESITGLANCTGGGAYPEGEKPQISAPEVDSYEFAGWYDGTTLLSSEATYTFATAPTTDKTITAVYRSTAGLLHYNVTATGAVVTIDGKDAPLSGTAAPGAELTFRYTGLQNFRMWMNASNKLITRETTYTLKLYTDVSFSAYEPEEITKTVVIAFMNEAGGLLSTIQTDAALSESDIPEVPYRANKTGGAWSMTLDEINEVILAGEVSTLEVTATYETETKDYEELTGATVPTVVLQKTDVIPQQDPSKATLSFGAVRSIPEGFTLVEQGLLLSTAAMTTDAKASEDMVVGSQKAAKMISNSASADGITYVNVQNVNDAAVIYARGYLIYRTSEGTTETVYTSVAKAQNLSVGFLE